MSPTDQPRPLEIKWLDDHALYAAQLTTLVILTADVLSSVLATSLELDPEGLAKKSRSSYYPTEFMLKDGTC